MLLPDAALLAELSGYAHDLGKGNVRFQKKLRGEVEASDAIRHETLSAWILDAMRATGSPFCPESLLNAWKQIAGTLPKDRERIPFGDTMASAMDVVLWSVLTHHGALGGKLGNPHAVRLRPHAEVPWDPENLLLKGSPFSDDTHDASRWHDLLDAMERIRLRTENLDQPPSYWEAVLWVTRAALILADHRISSQTFLGERGTIQVFANTKPREVSPEKKSHRGKPRKAAKEPQRYLDQPLSWHLTEVGKLAKEYVRLFSFDDLPSLSETTVEAILAQRASSKDSRFYWQDLAVDAVRDLPGSTLVFNIASTGAGKTLGNLKIACALRPDHQRLAVAFNLRTLTTQTYRAYAEHVRVPDPAGFRRDFACLLGERNGLPQDFSLEDEDDVNQEEELDITGAELALPSWLSSLATHLPSKTLAKLVAAPVLVSTIDWIVAAGEPGEQARHAQALLRVCSSDLILDEVDSYDAKAAVAVMRVIQTAAMYNRNVIVSSATLNPVLAQGIVEAFVAGQRM